MGIRGQQERLVLPRRVGLNKLMRIPVSQNLEQSWYGTGGVVVARPLPEVQDTQTLSGRSAGCACDLVVFPFAFAP